ncbi:MAG: hypothetical protein ABIY70_02040, partial [Capsulimonas sp.]|uniref:hypothetical protein n=1 Tax=Capsulimonas sp. TaxID=2494211 RepID=UPI003262CCD9
MDNRNETDKSLYEEYPALAGYLQAFIELQYCDGITDRDINAQGAEESARSLDLIIKQGRELLSRDDFPTGEIERLTGKWFPVKTDCRLWLERMLDELGRRGTSPKARGNQMSVSLKELLRTGVFAGIQPGTPKQQLLDLLGEPDYVGGTSRKYRRPQILVYGSVELYLDHATRDQFVSVFWDAEAKGEFRFSSRVEVLDWEWKPGMTRE